MAAKDKQLLLYALLRLHIVKGKVIIYVNTLELSLFVLLSTVEATTCSSSSRASR